MRLTWRTEWPHWLLLMFLFVLAASNWSSTSERIPVHWNVHGEVDRYGGRFEGLLLLPLVALTLYLAMVLLPRIDPGRANYAAFAGAYATLRLAILATLAAVYAFMLRTIHGGQVHVETVVPILIGALLIVIGSILGEIRPNWFFGIRTPWTLSSKRAWERTHSLGRWLFILMGILIVLMALIHAVWSFWFMIAVVASGGLVLVIYSYLVWRSDPEKIAPSGTLPG